jgi:TonB family protein
MRSLAVLLGVALFGVSPEPSPSLSFPPADAVPDRVMQLMGTWSCRNGYGLISKLTYRPQADGFVSTRVVNVPNGRRGTFTRVFRKDPDGGWYIEAAARQRNVPEPGSPRREMVPPWTGETWTVRTTYGTERFAFADANTLRLSDDDGGAVSLREICLRGETPPDPSTCITPELPTVVWQAVEPDSPVLAQQQRVHGTVRVRVMLDAASHVVGASVIESPSAMLNAAAVAAARRSVYLTARHECKPVPSEYVFAVDFNEL